MYHQSLEEDALIIIGEQLAKAGWKIQDFAGINLSAGRSVAVRKIRSKGGPADYVLFAR